MMQSLLNLSIVLPLLAGAPAPKKVEPPKGSPPEILLIQNVDPEKGTIMSYFSEGVPVTTPTKVKVVQKVGGVEKEEWQIVNVVSVKHVMKERVINLNDKAISATDTFGKKLTKEAVWKLVTPGKKIAITHDPKGLDQAYRSTLAPDVVILIIPPETLVLPPDRPAK